MAIVKRIPLETSIKTCDLELIKCDRSRKYKTLVTALWNDAIDVKIC